MGKRARTFAGRPLRALRIASTTAAIASLAAFVAASSSSVDEAALGVGSCSRYPGLPAGWGRDPYSGMRYIASGTFTPGTTLGYLDERSFDEPVRVEEFWIDQTEVTVAQFASFVAATGYVTQAQLQGSAAVFSTPDGAQLEQRRYAWWSEIHGADWRHPRGRGSLASSNEPVTVVTQADALAYANWLGRDLPTQIEWEFAAKAGHHGAELEAEPRAADGKPAANFWQGAFPIVDTREDGFGGLAPVGCFAANDFGLYDMIGNVWEWTKDPYPGPRQWHSNGDPAEALDNSPSGRAHLAVIKGGSFLCSRDFCVRYRASAREAAEVDLPTSHIGLRTVLRRTGRAGS